MSPIARSRRIRGWLLLAAALLLASRQDPPAEERRPWTVSRITGSPEPPPPYRLDRLFPKLTFDHPLEIVRFPGSDRIVVVEHHQEHLGRIFSFPRDPECAKADLFIDLPRAKVPSRRHAEGNTEPVDHDAGSRI